jgi:hypothetical protein
MENALFDRRAQVVVLPLLQDLLDQPYVRLLILGVDQYIIDIDDYSFVEQLVQDLADHRLERSWRIAQAKRWLSTINQLNLMVLLGMVG